ncbi:four-helix bundle copper-binding protein [Autumnicola psychrophila]|uniref:Four-helix bundle copper-binding protein n=1 Tax=Autumnicola psychrophila TaxID=3075592 RepID=A0ABU3DR55_9FLAO|nr:four-helix bundle copper-binding protein [Zunongwangia sp. F225]MDT0686196.1 four-helix bundle copper-binding protein [Zunongwangia sp. F225]
MRNEKLIHALGNCINHCNYCADACLGEDDVKKMVSCIRSDKVCAEACAALVQILAIKDADARDLVEYCRKVCKACADECEKHEAQHCKDCAKACRECEEACKAYLG